MRYFVVFKKLMFALTACAALALPASADEMHFTLNSGENLTGSFWESEPEGAPLQFFSERELKVNGLIQTQKAAIKAQANRPAKPCQVATDSVVKANLGNKYNMPAIYVNTTGVVYKRVPQADHRRRSLASRGAHSVQTAPATTYKTVAVREPIKLNITPIICKYAEKHRLDPWLVRAIIQVESGFCPTAGSYAGAGGLMQLMAPTAASLGCYDRFDPEANIAAGTRYLRQMINMFPSDIRLAIAAYNAGPGNVRGYGGIPPFAETRNYVAKVTRIWRDTKARAARG